FAQRKNGRPITGAQQSNERLLLRQHGATFAHAVEPTPNTQWKMLEDGRALGPQNLSVKLSERQVPQRDSRRSHRRSLVPRGGSCMMRCFHLETSLFDGRVSMAWLARPFSRPLPSRSPSIDYASGLSRSRWGCRGLGSER